MVNLADLRKKAKKKKEPAKKKGTKEQKSKKKVQKKDTPPPPPPEKDVAKEEPEEKPSAEREAPTPAPMEEKESFLLFSLGKEYYALPITIVVEILPLPTVTPVPNAEPDILGIASLRGQVIPILSLAMRFQSKESNTKEKKVIVVERQSELLGLVVDEVIQSISIAPSDIEAPPTQGEIAQGLTRWGKKLVILLDEEKL